MADYIPSADADFDTYQTAFITYAAANTAALGLVAGNITSLTTAQTAWTTAYPAHITAQASALAARTSKDTAKAALETVIRQMAQKVQGNLSVTDAQKAALGITVPDTHATPVGPPGTRPIGSADTRERLNITLSWTDEGSPTSKAKPAGVLGVQIYMKVDGPPPTDVHDCVFVALDTRTPYKVEFAGAQANKTAHFILRWINTRGEVGPISETVSATVPG